jgi:high-affinity Fe2+/Pb2+ permease
LFFLWFFPSLHYVFLLFLFLYFLSIVVLFNFLYSYVHLFPTSFFLFSHSLFVSHISFNRGFEVLL